MGNTQSSPVLFRDGSDLTPTESERFLVYWFEVVSIQELFKLDFNSFLQSLTLVSRHVCLTLKPFIEDNYFFRLYNLKKSKLNRFVWYAPKKFTNVKDVDDIPLNATQLIFSHKFNKEIVSLPPTITKIRLGFITIDNNLESFESSVPPNFIRFGESPIKK